MEAIPDANKSKVRADCEKCGWAVWTCAGASTKLCRPRWFAQTRSAARRGQTLCASMSNLLSVIIPCKNERGHLAACVTSVREIADEIVVADSGSTDGSLAIARSLGCRVIEREYRTSGDFKNWAIPQATHEWVLIVDCDERISSRLAAEIRAVLAEPRQDGYRILRRNHFLGYPIRFGPWHSDRCLRLFRRDMGRYEGPSDHGDVRVTSGRVGGARGADGSFHDCLVGAMAVEARSLLARAGGRVACGRATAKLLTIAADAAGAILSRLHCAARIYGRRDRAANLLVVGVLQLHEAGAALGATSCAASRRAECGRVAIR